MRKKIISVVAITLLGILAWRLVLLFSGSAQRKAGQQTRPPVAVEYDSVRYGPIQEARVLTGTIYPAYQYVVAPKVAGRLIEIRKRIGDAVAAGELIARIDDAEYQQAVLEAEANLRIAESALSEARSTFELAKQERTRVESLHQKGIASPAELDAASTNYQTQESRLRLAEAQVEQRKAALQAAHIRLSYTKLTASQPGFVGERFVDEGALLTANAAIVSVVGIDRVIVRTTVIERDYGKIKPGQAATVTIDAFPTKQFSGQVTRVAPLLQEAARVAQMEVEVDNKQHELKPGMFARVMVIIAEREKAQIIPSKALVTRDGESGLFVIADTASIVHYHKVLTGISTSDYTEIIEPHLIGKRVVTLGQHLLVDGSPIILPQPTPHKAVLPAAGGDSRP